MDSPGTDALVVGESLVDVVGEAAYAGGSGANTAVALARLGRPVRLWTAYAPDERGRLLADRLAAAGVVPAADPHVLPRSSTATATLGPDGAAEYVFDLDWRLAAAEGLLGRLLDGVGWVHVCSLGAVLEPGATEVRRLLDAGPRRVSYDLNARPSVTGGGPRLAAQVEQVASRADLVKASDEDLEVVYPGLTEGEAVARLRALGAGAVVVTRGAGGATWWGSGERVDVAARPVAVADTIGAGDTFAAALVDALWEADLASLDRGRVEAALAYAGAAAGVTVSRPGADPPTRSEIPAAPGPSR